MHVLEIKHDGNSLLKQFSRNSPEFLKEFDSYWFREINQ